jgi:hypothetical protein
MRTPLLVLLLFLFSSLYSNAQDVAYHQTSFTQPETYPTKTNQTVFICTGAYAYAYHSVANCPGLGNCKAEIVYTDQNTAAYSGKKPCCRCWSNVTGNCNDDIVGGSGGGGGGGGGDYAVVAVVAVAASAIVLSNDIYFYPTAAVKNGTKGGQEKKQFGYAFGFRKTFPKSALEYGVSTINDQWGYHLNYVHQILKSKMPEKITLYTGPALNYFDEFGYGGLVGASYQLLRRLNLDLRYEYTTQTNNLKLGFIFKYQRKYFWQR